MTSYNCCISKDPPSPDGLPPRPHFGKITSKDPPQINSWSTASAFSRLEDAAELRAIFETDDLNNNKDESATLMSKKSTSTLSAVKSKIRKHLPRDSVISKHWQCHTLLTRDQHTESQKEMKRIRNNRRHQELSNESSYDEDAKSLSTVTPNISPSRLVESNDSHPFLELETDHQNPLLSFLQRKSEAKLLELQKLSSKPQTIRRRHSFSTIDFSRVSESMFVTQNASLLGSLALQKSLSPAVEPQRLPNVVDSTTRRTSWRLSFASEDRAGQLRALSHEYEHPLAEFKSEATLLSATPLRWFRSQGLSIPSLTAMKLPSQSREIETLAPRAADILVREDFGGVDGSDSSVPISLHLYDMQISRRLASKGLHSSSSPQLSSWGSRSHLSGCPLVNGTSQHGAVSSVYHSQYTSSSDAMEKSSEDIIRDPLSSFNPSMQNSVQFTSLNFPLELTTKELEMADFRLEEGTNKETLPIPRLGTNASVDNLESAPIPPEHGHKEASLLLASETCIFRNREAELGEMKSRLPDSMDPSQPTTPIRSRFMENFGDGHIKSKAPNRNIPSPFYFLQKSKIIRSAPKSFDGISTLDLDRPQIQLDYDLLQANGCSSFEQSTSPGSKNQLVFTPSSPGMDPLDTPEDTTEAIWVNAIKKTQEEFDSKVNIQQPAPKKGSVDISGGLLLARKLSARLKGKQMNCDVLIKEGPISQLSIINGNKTSCLDSLLQPQPQLIEEDQKKEEQWADELEARERQAKAKTMAVNQVQPHPYSPSSPKSWSRYPSHTREERTNKAGAADNVHSRDFAIKEVNNGLTKWRINERKHHSLHLGKEEHHSLPTRLTKQTRSSLYKLHTIKNTLLTDIIHGRKSSVSVAGHLEYPELEILPGETGNELFQEVKRIERETEMEMRMAERAARMGMVVLGEGGRGGAKAVREEVYADDIPQTIIADPKFYDDCISLVRENNGGEAGASSNTKIKPDESSKLTTGTSRKEKYQTWSGQDRTAQEFREMLRRSTVEFQLELEKLEELEKDRVIESAEKAWGTAKQ